MIIPIRCMSCGKPIGQFWEQYKKESASKPAGEVMDALGLERYCCRAQFLGHVDLIDTAAKFKRF